MTSLTWTRRRRAAGRFWTEFRTHKAGVAGLAILVFAV
ncbi:MAG: ABC transporter permease, partial [Nonomuraea sp.]|nr:ABC transporter permease [Nonomuraea sp.]